MKLFIKKFFGNVQKVFILQTLHPHGSSNSDMSLSFSARSYRSDNLPQYPKPRLIHSKSHNRPIPPNA